ncbi:hypothetical protein [Paenibacillus popilliae]|uniref:FOG: TPR repeat n=1 Tax=Paenibacillus popilliae ATCC 14706 TaxID=1212764 RepID=M9M2W7_PAEPP|nr:hypothetical protein [Paenibacillus popilliae]GAC43339.1 FOG: TPR repeat [Paenibacillus popilliae ATCC 14706]
MEEERMGLRIRCDKNVPDILKKAFVHFAKWLRCHYNFPKRVPVYVKESYYIVNKFSKEQVSATFYAPFDKKDEPHIRIATGDFYDLEKELGRRAAILTTLNSLSHELQHYYQWIDGKEFLEEDEDFFEDEAVEGAVELTWEYIEDGFEEFWSSLDC